MALHAPSVAGASRSPAGFPLWLLKPQNLIADLIDNLVENLIEDLKLGVARNLIENLKLKLRKPDALPCDCVAKQDRGVGSIVQC